LNERNTPMQLDRNARLGFLDHFFAASIKISVPSRML
jgi:hypothetical protein